MIRLRGISRRRPDRSLGLERRDVHNAPLGPALAAELRELHALGPLQQAMAPVRVLAQMAQETFPLRPEGIDARHRIRHPLPMAKEIVEPRLVRIPDRPGRRHARLDPALRRAGNGMMARSPRYM